MTPSPTITTGELARRLSATLLGDADVGLARLDALELATPGSLTFVRSARYARHFAASRASAVLIPREASLADLIPGFDPAAAHYPRPLLVVPDVDLALIACADVFAPPPPHRPPGVHPTAFIDPSASVHERAHVGPHCSVLAHADLAADCVLVANVFVGEHARIGEGTTLYPGARVLDRCVVGRRGILHANCVIGADGFGFRPSADGRGLAKIPHIGNVVIDDDVEIGACSCVDRAKFGSTTIGAGTKIDNHVQVGHGCRIGRSVLLCGQAGLSGSVVVGDGVVLAGKAGVVDNVEIGAGARIGAHAGVTGSVPPKAVYFGMPAGPASEWRRTYAYLRRLGKRGGHHADQPPPV